MSRLTRGTRTALVVCATTLALLSSGCSSMSGPADSKSSSAPSSAAATEGAKDTTTPKDTEKSESPSPSTKKEPAPGTQTVTAPSSNLSFAAPEEWVLLSGEAVSEGDLSQAAETLGTSEDALRTQLSAADLYVYAPEAQGAFRDNITVAKQTVPASTPISEASLKLGLSSEGGTSEEYSTEQTAHGKTHLLSYSMDVAGTPVSGLLLVVPTESGSYAQIAITTLDKSTRDSLKETVLSSLR